MGRSFKGLFFLMAAIHLIACKPQKSDGLPRDLIEKYLDTSPIVHGPYALIKLPVHNGVAIRNPVQIVQGPDNLLYVANNSGEIYRILDTDGDGIEDFAALYCDVKNDGLRSPVSLLFRGNELFVGTAQAIQVYADLDGDGKADTSRVFFDKIPYSEHPYEWTTALTAGKDDFLYFVLSTDSWNAGASPDPNLLRGAIIKMNWDGTEMERFATGVRSVHSMVFLENKQLIFNDNEGGGNPTEELNLVNKDAFYGHNPTKYNQPVNITEPIHHFLTEVAPSGMAVNPLGNQFGGTEGDLFVAFYGPGERWERGAVARLRFSIKDGEITGVEEFPVVSALPKLSDLTFANNGDLYLTQVGQTDYWYQSIHEEEGAIYRMMFADWVKPIPYTRTPYSSNETSETLELGKQLFAERACSACHSVDGKTELLGPNLKDVGRILTRDELLEEINAPSLRIKPSMMGIRVTKKSGEILLGRVIFSNTESIDLMIVGNKIVKIPRQEIVKEENIKESLMYIGLLNGLTDEEVNALLAYLESLHLKND